MKSQRKWYAVHTRLRWEKKVAQTLSDKGITVYCPLNRILRQWSDRKKWVLEPLFQCYVFVQVSALEMNLVREVNGVLRFVNWLDKPAVIRDEEIETIRIFLDEHVNVIVEKVEVQVNDEVEVVAGLLTEYRGKILSVYKNRVKVLLPSLGYMMMVDMDKSHIKPLHKSHIACH